MGFTGRTVITIAAVLIIVSQGAAAEKIKAGGSGGMIPLISELGKAYMAKNPNDTIEVLKESYDAKGGIMGVYTGKLDIGLSARFLEPDEKSLNLTANEIARVATVIGVNSESVKITSLTKNQICSIYAGTIKNWKDVGGHNAKIVALTRPDADSTKKAVRKGLQCFSSLKEDAQVQKMQTSKDMLHGLTNAPNSIGLTDMVAVDDSMGKVAALNIEGITPSTDNIISGKWPIIKNFVIVTKGHPSGLVKRFIDFIKSTEGASIIKNSKAIAVN